MLTDTNIFSNLTETYRKPSEEENTEKWRILNLFDLMWIKRGRVQI
jgi:hypothetical protein